MKCITNALKEFLNNSHPDIGQPGGFIRPFHSKIMAISRAVDSLIIIASLWLSIRLFHVEWTEKHAWASIVGLILFQFIAEYNEVYRIWRGSPICKEAVRILASWFLAAMLLLSFGYFSWFDFEYTKQAIAVWFILTPVSMVPTVRVPCSG